MSPRGDFAWEDKELSVSEDKIHFRPRLFLPSSICNQIERDMRQLGAVYRPNFGWNEKLGRR